MRLYGILFGLAVIGSSLVPGRAAAQSSSEPSASATKYVPLHLEVRYYTTPSGYTFRIGDSLQLGRGTLPNGEFQFVYQSAGHKSLSAYWQYKVVSIRNLYDGMSGNEYRGRVMGAFRLGALATGYADLEAAVAAGEVVPTARQREPPPPPSEAETPEPAAAAPRIGVAEELLKFKQLLDAGAITQPEYERQKARLLGEQ